MRSAPTTAVTGPSRMATSRTAETAGARVGRTPACVGRTAGTAPARVEGRTTTSRRAFLARSCAAALGTALAACGGVAALPVTPRDGVVRLALRDHPGLAGPGGWLKIAPAGLAHPVYVLALADGSHVALSPVCTHQGCTVDIAGRQLVCPCHGSTYERTGEVVRGPAERPLARYETRREGGALLIRLP